jgi:AAA15 family ATPase/GTPase
MKIKLNKNKDIKLDIPKFSCDENAVGEHLNNHDFTKLLNVYGFLCVVGRPGSGKTSFTIALITQKEPKIYKKTHHHIFILMPLESIGSLKKNPFDKLPEENIINELTDETITYIYSKIEGYTKKGEKT